MTQLGKVPPEERDASRSELKFHAKIVELAAAINSLEENAMKDSAKMKSPRERIGNEQP
jgi:hypothetical protein